MTKLPPFVVAATLGLFAAAAQAESPFSHPAMAKAGVPVLPSIQAREASPALVGHPASPRWTWVHANHDHPAVAARRVDTAGIDTNAFLVQPPASTSWTLAPAGKDQPTLARQ
ncbi:MAG: hypothetical protein RL375_3227 [Pseudomonadota bacterium]